MLALLSACGAPGSQTATGPRPEPTPLALPTRPDSQPCGERPLPAEPLCDDPADACKVHADCRDRAGGTCTYSSDSFACRCAYDECRADRDCAGGEVCGCASDRQVSSDINVCLPADCRTNADCASGRCQLGVTGAGAPDCIRSIGWYCTGPQDECDSDQDCVGDHYKSCEYAGDKFLCTDGTEYTHGCD